MENKNNNGSIATNRIEGIEILRGFAAVAVIFYHVLVMGEFQNQNSSLVHLINHCGMAVPLFYALSAFSLLYGYEKNIFDEFTMKRFYIRRFFRLAPLFYFMLLFYTVYFYFVFDVLNGISVYLLDITFTYMLVPTQHESIVWAGWSVGIEWLFYFVFPLMVIISRSKIVLTIAFIISLIISIKFATLTQGLATASPSSNYMSIMKHMVFFFGGMLVYKMLPLTESIKQKVKWIKHIDLVYFLFGVVLFALLETSVPYEILESLFFMVLLFGAVLGYSPLLNNRLTHLFGRVSYGLYLLNPILIITMNNFGFYTYIKSLTSHFIFNYLLGTVATIFIITLFSTLAYYLIEQPGIQLGQKLINRMKQKA